MDLTASFETAVPADVFVRYEFFETRNAASILRATNEAAFAQVMEILREFELIDDDLVLPGGEESGLAKRLNYAFRSRGWREGRVDTVIKLQLRLMPFAEAGETEARVEESSVTNEGYKVDNVRDRIAMDLEWNAKDGNLDRDLAAYRALYEAGLINGAILVTRTVDDLRALGYFVRVEAGMSDAEARKVLSTSTTTNTKKLLPRLQRGDAGGCPVLAVAICERTWRDWQTQRDYDRKI
ncbi:MAG: hypothetical protein LBR33_06570 [Propionibacteriaceae bacterium]|jgi:hypothetical protein|nr:hypothetical protein [Propionibacteriaceae bacterium]